MSYLQESYPSKSYSDSGSPYATNKTTTPPRHFKLSIVIEFNSHTYELEFNSRDLQKVKIRLTDPEKSKENWQEIIFRTIDQERLDQGLQSIGLLYTHRGNVIGTGPDVTEVMGKELLWPNANFKVKALDIINAAINEDNRLGLLIIGGHRIKGLRPSQNFSGQDKAFVYENYPHPLTGVLTPEIKTYKDSPWYSLQFEEEFNQTRAETVQQEFFHTTKNVSAKSRNQIPHTQIGNVRLPAYNQDPVGITILFEFKKQEKSKEKIDEPSFFERSVHPRFL